MSGDLDAIVIGAGFGGLTSMQLVQRGQAAEVMDYIDAVDSGLHA